MDRARREWLLACPMLGGVSTLAIDLCSLGAIDLTESLAIATASELFTLGAPNSRPRPRSYFERSARYYSRGLHPPRLTLVGSVLTTVGALAPGLGVCEDIGRAVVHFRGVLPHTAVVAMAGRRMADVVGLKAFEQRPYPVTAAKQAKSGVVIWFELPAPLPVEALTRVKD